MDSLQQSNKDDSLKKSQTQIADEEPEGKQSFSSEEKAPINLVNIPSQNVSYASKKDPSAISDTDSLPEKVILTPLGNPNLKDLKYISKEIPIYANLLG